MNGINKMIQSSHVKVTAHGPHSFWNATRQFLLKNGNSCLAVYDRNWEKLSLVRQAWTVHWGSLLLLPPPSGHCHCKPVGPDPRAVSRLANSKCCV